MLDSATAGQDNSPTMDDSLDPAELFKAEVRRKAQADGLSADEAEVLASVALDVLRVKAASKRPGSPVTKTELADAVKQHAVEEVEKSNARKEKLLEEGLNLIGAMTQEELDEFMENNTDEYSDDYYDYEESEDDREGHVVGTEECGVLGRQAKRFVFEADGLEEVFGEEEEKPYDLCADMANLRLSMCRDGMDLITALCQSVELTVEIAKHLRPEDLLTLYSTSRAFYQTFNGHALSVIRQVIAHKAPEAGRVFAFNMYRRHLVIDPAGRVWGYQMSEAERYANNIKSKKVRTVPGMRYLQLVLTRDRCCRESLAMLARMGHRTPHGTLDALLRMWLTMEVGLTSQREAMMRSKLLWRNRDLFNAQLFFVKLTMLSNEPSFGERRVNILQICLSQRCGLMFLWEVLLRKRWTTAAEIMQVKLAYRTALRNTSLDIDRNKPTFGVPFININQGHSEGWGSGHAHLMRPDELVAGESIRRGLDLHIHLKFMALWGYWDWFTGENLVPTEEEIYISDEETTLAHMDTSHHWKKKHAMKKRWLTLTPEQQRQVRETDEDERLMALAWASKEQMIAEDMGDGEARAPKLEHEIERGIIVHMPKSKLQPPKATDSVAAWAEYSSKALSGVPHEPAGDEALRAQALHHHGPEADEWDWLDWLEQDLYSKDALAAAAAAQQAQEDAEMANGEDDGDEDESEDNDDEAGSSDDYGSYCTDDNGEAGDEDMEADEETGDIVEEVLARVNGGEDVVMADGGGTTGSAEEDHMLEDDEDDMSDCSGVMLRSGQDLEGFVNGFFQGNDL